MRWWGPSWRNTTRRVKLKACVMRLLLLLNILRRLSQRHSCTSISTLGRFHITSSQRRTSCKVLPRTHHGIKDDHWCISETIYHRAYADWSFHSIQEGRGQWYVGDPDAYFRFNPRGTSKDSCKWRRKTYSRARSTRLCGG
jgi:hypothetical protein